MSATTPPTPSELLAEFQQNRERLRRMHSHFAEAKAELGRLRDVASAPELSVETIRFLLAAALANADDALTMADQMLALAESQSETAILALTHLLGRLSPPAEPTKPHFDIIKGDKDTSE